MYQDDENGDLDGENVGGPPLVVRAQPRDPRRVARQLDPTIRWGDTLTLEGAGIGDVGSGQFLNILLSAPRVCSLAINGEVTSGVGLVVNRTVIELFVGVGSSTYSRRIAYGGMPAIGNELNDIIANLPVNRIYLRATVGFLVAGSVRLTAHLTPVFPDDEE